MGECSILAINIKLTILYMNRNSMYQYYFSLLKKKKINVQISIEVEPRIMS
jgi:hypothetical protein